MNPIVQVLHTAVRNSRRARGLLQTRKLSVSGTAPNAVITALQAAARGRPAPDEKAWIEQIERLRQFLLTSPQPFEIEDLGAGPRSSQTPSTKGSSDTTVRTIGKMTQSSKPPQWAYLLFRLIRELKPATVLELGSCVGISAAYQAAALELNGMGRLITLEGIEALVQRSSRTLEELGLNDRAEVRQGRFSETISGSLADLRPLGCAFIDGHHEEQATLDYTEQILPAVGDEALLVYDDINWSDGMRRAWQQIVADERFALTVDLRSVGLAVVSQSATQRQTLLIGYF